MSQLLEAAARISTSWALAAFAIAAIFLLLAKRRGKVPPIAWAAVVAIVLLGLVPIIVSRLPNTATSLNSLASLLKSKGDYAGAEPLYRRALAIRQKALGPDHPDTATSLNNLAELLRSKGEYAGAEPLFRRALAITEKALGPDHPDTATSL
ncbi:MAG: tetratricopeptide repeat protein, partial [Bryobacteraceae bacterium]